MHSMEVTDDMSLHLLHTSAPPMVTRSVSNTPSAVSDTLDLAGCSAFYTSERSKYLYMLLYGYKIILIFSLSGDHLAIDLQGKR
jgi:hypothetical protein